MKLWVFQAHEMKKMKDKKRLEKNGQIFQHRDTEDTEFHRAQIVTVKN